MKLMKAMLTATAIAASSQSAKADITLFMEAWESLPQAEITQGKHEDCAANQVVFGPALMSKGFRKTFPGTGANGDDLCYRRTADPLHPDSGWTMWGRCSTDGDCEIR
ncbi:MAG TPA: hypothetical protein VMT54_16190 [Candidatus Cybelea sp.]|nr:hypothetical protein [Candidatus Cybelea sp.]